jgi:prolyl-tRNA editing enzyme YbaK/EbsC (Cys-tRNA(Pro) deacylase)
MALMGSFTLGALSSVPASQRPDLLAQPTLEMLERHELLERVGVVEIDPDASDTAATQQAFGLDPDMLANCVVVGGKREGTERLAACVVLSTTRADVNGTVRRYLDVRKASFLTMERAVALTGMEYGGITPIGLPPAWPVLVDQRVTGCPAVVIGSGVRRSKILLPGPLFAQLPNVTVLHGLGLDSLGLDSLGLGSLGLGSLGPGSLGPGSLGPGRPAEERG